MAKPILPTANELVTAAIDEVVAARPSTLAHFNNPNSRYSALTKIWRAQANLGLLRLAGEVNAARLRTSTGDELRALCASEFNTSLGTEPQTAIASVQLVRWTGAMPAGVIRKGAIFSKAAAPSASPLPVASATYVAQQTVPVAQGQTNVTVNLVAQAAGPAANIPIFSTVVTVSFDGPTMPAVGGQLGCNVSIGNGSFSVGDIFSIDGIGAFSVGSLQGTTGLNIVNTGATSNAAPGASISGGALTLRRSMAIQPGAALQDPNFHVVTCEAAGGSSGLTDPVLVAAAKAYARGQYGPTDAALIAGALRSQAVRYSAFFRPGALSYSQAFLADETWSSGVLWTSMMAQTITTDWLGFGSRVRYGTIVNQLAALAPTVVLKSTDDLANTDEIDTNVRAAARAYFDTRPDWYLWRVAALQAAIARADARILRCTGVSVTDATTGATLAEPANTFGSSWSPTLTHVYVGASADAQDNTLTSTYLPPS